MHKKKHSNIIKIQNEISLDDKAPAASSMLVKFFIKKRVVVY